MALFYGRGSTPSRLGDSLLFTAKSLGVPGTHLINFGRIIGLVHLKATQWLQAWNLWIGNPMP